MTSEETQARGMKPRRIYITKEDVSDSRYGPAPGCRRCEAANRGEVGVHNVRCRSRIEAEIMKKDPERHSRVLTRRPLS